MVKEIVRHVIANISEDTATVYKRSGKPVVEEDGMRQFPEGHSKDDEQGRGHHKSILVHRQVVVYSMQKEMQSDTNTVVRKKTGKR